MGQKIDASRQTLKKSRLKELSMSEKLLYRPISKSKSQSVYIVAHLQANLKVQKILLIWIIQSAR